MQNQYKLEVHYNSILRIIAPDGEKIVELAVKENDNLDNVSDAMLFAVNALNHEQQRLDTSKELEDLRNLARFAAKAGTDVVWEMANMLINKHDIAPD